MSNVDRDRQTVPMPTRRTRRPVKALRRFRRRRTALLGVSVILLLALVSLVTLPFTTTWYNVQELNTAVRHGPALSPIVPLDQFESVAPQARPGRVARVVHRASSWFGHDDLGRSVLFRVLPGFLVSMGIGVAAAVIAVVVGTLWGATAALAGGRVDLLMMRVVDVLYGLPYILTVILLKVALTRPLSAMFGGHTHVANLMILLLAIGGVSWLTMARVIRGQVLSLRGLPFVDAARAAGARPFYILRRHLLPNLVGPIITYASLVIPQAILQESFLSFLGIGVQQPTPSLGRLAADGIEAVNAFVGYWWLIVFPCGVLVVTLLALNFIGDALRDAYDPKSSSSVMLV
ncbi:MAG: ABC transporter permease [Phycisphaerae bacterium]|jgi:ABC-type dipeptide/oligopeptide/nickel transport system permease subunit